MCLCSGLWGVLDCDSHFTILSPLSFDEPHLWCSVSVCSSVHPLKRAHCAQYFLPRSLCGWPGKSLHLLEEGQNHPIVRFAYLCHIVGRGEEFVFLSFLYTKLSELGVEVAFNNRSAVTHHKVNLLNSHFRVAALSAPMMLLCCSVASASFSFCFFHL